MAELLIRGTDIFFIAVAVTTAWVGCDAAVHKIAFGNGPYSARNGAVAWVMSCLTCWIAVFPWYLSRRSRTLQEREKAVPAQRVTVIVRHVHLLSEWELNARARRR